MTAECGVASSSVMTAPVDGGGDDDAARARDANADVVTDVPAKRAKTTPTSARGEPSPGTAAPAPTETRPASTSTDARASAREGVVPGAGGGTAVAQGVPGGWDHRAFASWLDARGVRRVSEKKRRAWRYGFVVFGTMEERIRGTEAMEACEFNGRSVRVRQATAKGKSARDGGLVSAEGRAPRRSSRRRTPTRGGIFETSSRRCGGWRTVSSWR